MAGRPFLGLNREKLMKLSLIMTAAIAFTALGCLKQQPVVQAPILIDIPPAPKSAETAEVPPSPVTRLKFVTPAGWDVESRRHDFVTFYRRDGADAVIFAYMEDEHADSPRNAEEFHESVRDALVRKGRVVSSYLSLGPNGDPATVRFSSETGCGTSIRVMVSVDERAPRFVVAHGTWPCDGDVENDASLRMFIQSINIVTE